MVIECFVCFVYGLGVSSWGVLEGETIKKKVWFVLKSTSINSRSSKKHRRHNRFNHIQNYINYLDR